MVSIAISTVTRPMAQARRLWERTARSTRQRQRENPGRRRSESRRAEGCLPDMRRSLGHGPVAPTPLGETRPSQGGPTVHARLLRKAIWLRKTPMPLKGVSASTIEFYSFKLGSYQFTNCKVPFEFFCTRGCCAHSVFFCNTLTVEQQQSEGRKRDFSVLRFVRHTGQFWIRRVLRSADMLLLDSHVGFHACFRTVLWCSKKPLC